MSLICWRCQAVADISVGDCLAICPNCKSALPPAPRYVKVISSVMTGGAVVFLVVCLLFGALASLYDTLVPHSRSMMMGHEIHSDAK
jgi:hypothetical protein